MAGVFGNGAVFKIGTTTVSEITNVSGPNFSADDIDVTSHNNSTKFREFVKGLTDAGEITIEGNMDYTDYNTVYATAITTSLQSLSVNLPTSPSATQWLANGYCKSFEVEAPHDDKISFTAGFKVTGKPLMQKV
jgi:hypothetical protein